MFKNYLIWFEATSQEYFHQFSKHPEPEKLYKNLAKTLHPDVGGHEKEFASMQNGYEQFKKQNRQPFDFRYSQSKETPPWQTDWRSSFNGTNGGFRNVNFCKKTIYEKAIENGLPLEKYFIRAFDGTFFRGAFEVFANKPTLGFAGYVMEQWNSHGANPYDTEAVFASIGGSKDLHLIRLDSKDIANKNIFFNHESFNYNPSNDQKFMREIRSKLDMVKEQLK